MTTTELDDSDSLDPMDVKVELESFVRRRLDTIGLLRGAAVDCDVVQMELPNGDVQVLGTEFDGLSASSTGEPFAKVTIVAELVIGVGLALSDFRQAIRVPVDTALFCYRGLDGIREDIANREGIGNESEAWNRMRVITDLDRQAEIEPIKRLADARRHGGTTTITHDQRAHALQVLQKAILAYVDWCAVELQAVRRAVEQIASQPSGRDRDESS